MSTSQFNIYNNNLCPPYPECIEDYVGDQDTSERFECLSGDINEDLVLDILDVVSIVYFIIGSETIGYNECGDYNGDGYLNILDVVQVVSYILDE